jgi:hypothetical protein
MTLNEMKLRWPLPNAAFPPTIKASFAEDGASRNSPNSLKTWWPGTELNRRRQPFQNRGFEYFQRFTSRRGPP